jgi:hypothetical protein
MLKMAFIQFSKVIVSSLQNSDNVDKAGILLSSSRLGYMRGWEKLFRLTKEHHGSGQRTPKGKTYPARLLATNLCQHGEKMQYMRSLSGWRIVSGSVQVEALPVRNIPH